MKIKILLFIALMSLWFVAPIDAQADSTIPFNVNGNVFAYDSPYNVTFEYEWGPQDMLKITIEGNLSDVQTILFTNLTNILPLTTRDVDYTAGTGMFARIENTRFDSVYDTWYDQMILNTPTLTNDIDIYFYPVFSSGLTETQLTQIIRTNLEISFNRIIDLSQFYDDVYEQGYENGYSDAGIISNGTFYTAEQYGNIRFSAGYDDGVSEGTTDALAIRNMIPGILGVTFAFFFQLASISFLGISLLQILVGMITIAGSIFVIRIFLNR